MNGEKDFLAIEQFNTYIQNWSNSKVKIMKLEMNDYDEVTMDLDSITYKNEILTIDGYEPIHTLQLNGTGTILTESSMSEPLPSPTYEIPIEKNTLYEFDGNTFIISTDRAVYKLEKA